MLKYKRSENATNKKLVKRLSRQNFHIGGKVPTLEYDLPSTLKASQTREAWTDKLVGGVLMKRPFNKGEMASTARSSLERGDESERTA